MKNRATHPLYLWPYSLNEWQPIHKLVLQRGNDMEQDQQEQRLGKNFMRLVSNTRQLLIFAGRQGRVEKAKEVHWRCLWIR
jgi:hypothetical protein